MRWLISFYFCIWALQLEAAELHPWLKDKKIGLTISNMSFPENFSKDLKSGFTNKFLVHATMDCGSKMNAQKLIEIGIKYDLWAESFLVTINDDANKPIQTKYSSLNEITSFLEELKLKDLFPIDRLVACKMMTSNVEILLNPIAKEKADKIKRWVAENSVSTPRVNGLTNVGPADAPRSSQIFNKIFEQYSNGATMAAIWKLNLSTKPFMISELPHEK
ncbi:MAG: hypothetical protein ACXWC9_01890 [Pseudobdellovibrionaceae bacterium]